MIAKLQDKNKMYKRLAENAEEMVSVNLAKLRRAQAEADFDLDHICLSESESTLNKYEEHH